MNYTAGTYSNINPALFYGGGFCGGVDPRREQYAGEDVAGVEVPNYKTKYEALQNVIKDNYATFEVDYYGADNDNYVAGEGFCCGDNNLRTKSIADDSPNYEKLQYYYHSDHLGSASYITNLDGEVVQHIEYVPFGEVFLEERNNTWNTPFLFNGKELDEETGLYYYGARYYNPRISLWYGVDPLAEKYPAHSPYCYTMNNPVMLIDPDGRDVKWKTDKNSSSVKAKVDKLRANSEIFNNLYNFLDNLPDIFDIEADDQKVQKAFQKATGGSSDVAGGYTTEDGKSITFSDIHADQDTFSEEFFHLYQKHLYGNIARNSQELDAEAKLFNAVVGLETENVNPKIKGITAVTGELRKNKMSKYSQYYNGSFVLIFSEIVNTKMQISPNSQAKSDYDDYLKGFGILHNQTKNNVYGGKQRSLFPDAYNSIIKMTK